jgi:GAF domain-containing protein
LRAGGRPRPARTNAGKPRAASTAAGGDYLRILRLVSEVANEATGIEAPLRAALDEVCALTGWPVGHVFLKSEDRDEMVPAPLWHMEDAARYETFRRVTMATPMPRGIGLPGRVLASGEPAWITDITRDRNFPRNTIAAPLHLKAAFGFPVRVGREVAAMLEFFSPERAEPQPAFLEVMDQVGTLLGRAIERVRAEEAFGKLARAVSEKSGDEFFASLARQLVGTLGADFAFIGEVSEDGRSITTVAGCDRGGPMNDFTYSLEGTPCEDVIMKQFCSYERGVQEKFPRDKMLAEMKIESYVGTPLMDADGNTLGLLVVLWKTPPVNIRIAESMAQIFAVRASTELERRRCKGSLQKFSALPQVTPHPMMEFAGDGSLRFVNDAAKKLMASLGKTDPWAILPADTVNIVRKCLATGKNGLIFDTIDGEHRTISWSFIPILPGGTVFAHAFELSLFMALQDELRRMRRPSGLRPPSGRLKGSLDKADVPGGKVH